MIPPGYDPATRGVRRSLGLSNLGTVGQRQGPVS